MNFCTCMKIRPAGCTVAVSAGGDFNVYVDGQLLGGTGSGFATQRTFTARESDQVHEYS